MRQLARRVFGPDWGIRSIDGYATPNSLENREAIARLVLPMLGGLGLLAVLGWTVLLPSRHHYPGFHVYVLLAVVLSGLVVVVPTYWLTRRITPLWVLHLYVVLVLGMLTLLSYEAGPEFGYVAALGYVPMGTITFVLLRRRIAVAYITVTAITYGVISSVVGEVGPFTHWIDLMGGLTLVGATVAQLVDRVRELAQREHAATEAARSAQAEAEQARERADQLARTLEERVGAQVDELNRLGKLRRFLAPQVADTVLAADDDSILEPHRQRIAVFYCDLRGFTHFAAGAEPEDVVQILDEYYHAVGELIRSFNATVGTFAGDGIMAYFNDPVPCEDPAGRAVDMALELREPMTELVSAWRTNGFDLNYGVGVTYGYATLGTIGFETRNDYTAIGSVVNLAARLCGEAHGGEILIDQRAQKEVAHRLETTACSLVLKGITMPVTAYLVFDPRVESSSATGQDASHLASTHEE